jgi:predicted metallopeptidase
MAQAKYFDAPEVAEIAQSLIAKYHQHLIDFSVKIRYVFVDKTPNSKGKEVWGTCRKISGLNAYLEGENPDGDPFFVITISKDVWDLLPSEKKLALVDHELCHAWAEVKQQKNESDDDSDMETDNPVKLNVKPHDLEEFSCIVRRHGLWREDIEAFVDEALKAKKNTEEEE